MGNIGDSFITTLPTVGSSGPAYATSINDIMTEVMLRLSTKVPLSSLSLGSSLDMNGQAILNAQYITLLNTASTPGASPINRWTAFGGNAYWVSPAGAVQVTNGTSLNSGALGGIIGDYGGANPAKVSYVSASTRYEFYHDFGAATWANLRAQGIDISAASTGTVMAQLRYGGAGTLTFTLPPTLPAAVNTAILGISNTGAITSNPSITQDITLSGSTVVKHGDRIRTFFLDTLVATAGSFSSGASTDAPFRELSSGTTAYWLFSGFDVGERIKKIALRIVGTAGNFATSLFRTDHTTASASSIAVTNSDAGGIRSVTLNTPYTIVSTDGTFQLKMVQSGGTVTDIYTVQITYDRP